MVVDKRATGLYSLCLKVQCLQLEQGMSYNATYFFEYMNTYADILYAYGAYVHGSQYSRRSQIRLIARLQSGNGTRYCSSGSQWKKKQKQHSSQQKQHNRKSTQHIIFIYPSVAISVHWCLHWCSHLTSIPPSCIGVRTLLCTFRWS